MFIIEELVKRAKDDNMINSKEYEFTLEDEVSVYEQVKRLRQDVDNLNDMGKNIIKDVYIEDKILREVAANYNINYKKAIKIKKESLSKMRNYLE